MVRHEYIVPQSSLLEGAYFACRHNDRGIITDNAKDLAQQEIELEHEGLKKA
jgi:hypothetical protein